MGDLFHIKRSAISQSKRCPGHRIRTTLCRGVFIQTRPVVASCGPRLCQSSPGKRRRGRHTSIWSRHHAAPRISEWQLEYCVHMVVAQNLEVPAQMDGKQLNSISCACVCAPVCVMRQIPPLSMWVTCLKPTVVVGLCFWCLLSGPFACVRALILSFAHTSL